MIDVQENTGMRQWDLPVKTGRLLFLGRLLGEEDNYTDKRVRWAHLKAFEGHGINEENAETYGQKYYLLYAIGHSLVVHDSDSDNGDCRGRLAEVREFPDLNEDWEILEPCPRCTPGFSQDSPPDAVYMLEVTRYSANAPYMSAAALVDALRKCRSCGHRPHERGRCSCGCKAYLKGDLSQIGQRLLDKVRLADREVAEALPAEIRL